MTHAARYAPTLPRQEMARAVREWVNFKMLVRRIMIQVGRVVDEADEGPAPPPNPPRNFAGWKATILQLRHCDGVFRRIQQFVNQDLEEFANPFQQFMSVHTPVLQTVITGLQGLVTPHNH